MIRKVGFFLFLSLFFFLAGCSIKSIDRQTDLDKFSLDSKTLYDEIYYFPAKKPNSSDINYQALKRFDLIFVGHDINNSSEKFKNLSALIPGVYTHVLMYIGKDRDGFAYAIEMNADKKQTFTLDNDGLKIGGKLYFYCLGSDFNKKSCPKSDYAYGLKSYDYMWAKRLKVDTKKYEKKLLLSIKKDYQNKLPFQIPLHVSLKTKDEKIVKLFSSKREDGASCAEYFVSLFEDTMDICIDDVRIDAKSLKEYYMHDKLGKEATIPLKYAVFFEKEVSLKDVFGKLGYDLVDDVPQKTRCKDRVGVATPDLFFNSNIMMDIDGV